MSEHNPPGKVVVIGGGYAGALAANIRPHQFVAGTGEATRKLGSMPWRKGGPRPEQPAAGTWAVTSP